MRLMAVALAGWINQQQEDVIDYLREEVRILKELQGKKRLRDADRHAARIPILKPHGHGSIAETFMKSGTKAGAADR